MADFAAHAGLRSLKETDPEIYSLVEQEKDRQFRGLELIASENFTSRAVMEVTGSVFTNKYSEGQPGMRYYGGNENVDEMEVLCQKRGLEVYRLDSEKWGLNVQPYSGSTANFAVYTALLQPHDRLMGLDLPSGGHLTHGFYTAKKKVSATSIFWESLPYKLCEKTGYVDYDKLEELALLFRPKLIIAGGSAYPREWDYARMRKIADAVGAYFMADMAHISGLVAAQEADSPFEHCHVVTSTTHKSLRGPRKGMIFYRKGGKRDDGTEDSMYDLEDKINQAVFPALQGGPHNHVIAGLAVAFKEALEPSFKTYIKSVKANAKALGEELVKKGYKLVTGGTDNHLMLWDLRSLGLTGNKMEKLYEIASITLNKNAVQGDKSAFNPGGLRIGLPALTTRGMTTEHMVTIAEFLHRGIETALRIQNQTGKLMKDFAKALPSNEEVISLRNDVEAFAKKFPMPGFNPSEIDI